jgi:Transcription factor WhiB
VLRRDSYERLHSHSAEHQALLNSITTAINDGGAVPCVSRRHDPELWYAEDKRSEEIAKYLCRQCPVADECFRYAMGAENHGVWGGATTSERHALRRVLAGRTA